jgi:cytochrome c oxidase cbb3-type subunit 3
MAPLMNKIAQLPVADIAKNPQLLSVAIDDGQSAFANNCQPCHGAGGSGRKGFPVLASDAWLWGGTLQDIQQSITYGIRSGHPEARVSDMPHFGADGILTPDQINHVADYVLFLAGKPRPGVDVAPGKAVFTDNCAVCHGDHGQGNRSVGAPRYFDRVFLYGENHDAIVRQVTMPHEGVMPAWTYRLDLATIKCLTLYVHSLGGGE